MTVTPCHDAHHGHHHRHGLDRLLKDVVAAQLAFGKEVVHLVGAGAKAALGELARKDGKDEACCDMPEACWMPKPLGEIHCWLRPGCSGEVKLNITNNDYLAHNAVASAAGQGKGHVAFTPAKVALGPKERATITAHFTAPTQHGTYEAVLWVAVCSDHYLRWTVHVGDREGPCCYEVTVDDNPDYAVHWYDHFYCRKPCMGTHGKG